ncbi:MAG: ribbon-helix-helix protein, CopG family [Acidobacteriales bacterium]|nr:ribbon-helix-helix protein, CopG family [Terriglobales bacterium]
MTVRVGEETRAALDAIAAALDRDRSYIVNEALDAYIEMHQWQIEHIQRGLADARTGRFVPDTQVNTTLDRLRRR